MPRVKSLIIQTEIDEAKRAHNCQGNSRHRLSKGNARLNVRKGRSWDRYCIDCAKTILSRDINKLQQLQKQIEQL